MKLITNVLILALTGTALAQAPANKPGTTANKPAAAATAKPVQVTPAKPVQATPVKPAQTGMNAPAKPAQANTAKPAQGSMAKPATAVTKAPATPAKPATAAAKPATAPSSSGKKPVSVKDTKKAKPVKKVVAKSAPAATPAGEEKKKSEEVANAKNRRDPFVSVIVNREGTPCAGGGKKCIDISQVILQGVVRAPSGPIAVISSGANKTYFLRENDPVYNGVVVKISPDSIIFRETVMDRIGKVSQREVVKKIRSAPSA